VEPVDGQKVSVSELRRFLLDRLPDYMVPSAFVMLDALPLTPNGKVDRSKLPAPNADLILAADTAFVAPRTPVEETLAGIWATVLGVKRLGIHDNFFELGGDSILSIQLIARAAQQNIKLKPNDIFRAPTIEQMSQVLQQGGGNGASSSLVAIQAEGLKPPLYFVPGNYGNVFTDLGYIARYLGSDQPFYGLQDTTDMPSQIPAMAERYVAQIRAFQPAGPYLLGGVCSGGLVAYEMAQQLLRQGHRVALLALVEKFAEEPNVRNLLTSMTDILHRLFRLLGSLSTDDGQGEKPQTRAPGRRELGAFLRLKVKVAANILGAASYSPKPYPGRVDVFLTEESLAQYEPRVSWSRFAAGGAEMHKLPGTHATITGDNAEISKASMKVLAQQLAARIDVVLAKPQPVESLDETITTQV